MRFRAKTRWLSQISGAVFLITYAYMRSKFIFESGDTAGGLLLISMIAALLTFGFGVMSLPRWQGFVGLAICAYALYWFVFGTHYAVP